MNNEPELKFRENLLNDFNSKNFTKLLNDIDKLLKSFPNSLAKSCAGSRERL